MDKYKKVTNDCNYDVNSTLKSFLISELGHCKLMIPAATVYSLDSGDT
jgi:hypothetical protein